MKIKPFLFALYFTVLSFSTLIAQNTYVPDDNFEQALIDLGYDSGELNDSVPTDSVNTVTELDVSGKSILDLTGIESFTALAELNISNNQISTIDLSFNSNLVELSCYNNELSNLSLVANSIIETINCSNNLLTNLNLNSNTVLININCSQNNLSALNLKNGNNLNMTVNVSSNSSLSCIEVDDEIWAANSSGWSKDETASYSEDCENQRNGIPGYEYDALFDLYNSSIGSNWHNNTNWLDTLVLANDWYGITVENGHVTRIILNDNNLQETAFSQVAFLPYLRILELEDNLLDDFDFLTTDSLISLDTLVLNNNSLIFEDLIPAFNRWNYDNFSENFHYQEQNKIGSPSEQTLETGINQIIGINANYVSDGDILQWFKDSQLLENQSSSSIILIDVALADSGSYHVEITNPNVPGLTLKSHNILLHVINNEQDINVPVEEYDALVDLYNSTNGEEWINNTNWLDTTTASVADWYGITVESGHVTKIDLNHNNLQEIIETDFSEFPELQFIDLSYNNLSSVDFSKLETTDKLNTLKVEWNNFLFNPINQIFNLSNFGDFSENFTYAPQNKFDVEREYGLVSNEELRFEVDPTFIDEEKQIQWYKNNEVIPDATEAFFVIENASKTDTGTYYFEMKDPSIPDLILQSNNHFVSLTNNTGISKSELISLIQIYNETNGDNWTNNTNWLDTTVAATNWYGINVTNGHITDIYLRNNKLTGTIPEEIGNFPMLSNLNLGYNEIFGPIPTSIENLSVLTILDLEDNNLGTDNNLENGAKRQIPDIIGTLPLNTFHIARNQLQFNDIEPIFSWNNFANINQFTYDHQWSQVNDTIIEAEFGTTVKITLKNYIPGASDKYQWVKGNYPIEGATNAELIIENAKIADEERYYCLVSNSVVTGLEILNYGTTLKVNGIHGAGVPLDEYKALEAIYNATNGDNWDLNTNWLDTTNHSVSDWAGIEVINGHVYALQMDSNNVVGQIPDEFYNLTYLQHLNIVNNQISGTLSSLISEMTELTVLSLHGNELSGTIPNKIGDLSQLEYLGLSQNQFTGEIPPELGNLTNLKWLILDYNRLSGFVPLELDNLTKIIRFTIENNLLGQTDDSKSALLSQQDEHRVLPAFLSEWIDLDTLHISNNSIQFNDIEAIFSWDNFNDFQEFIYSPQDEIGQEKTISGEEEKSIVLSIDNYYPGTSDTYQWYKGEQAIENGTSKDLFLENLTIDDAGEYHCVVSNPVATNLILTSKAINLVVTDKQPEAGIPQNEYLALENIFHQFGNPEWENWLDTLSGKVGNWQGITLENGHVVAIDLSSLNIEGEIFDILTAFDSLTWLNLSNNNLSGKFPTFNGNKSSALNSVEENGYNLSYLNISNNNFTFSDLEPVADELLAIDTFIYSPQQKIGSAIDTSMYKYEQHTIEIGHYSSGLNDTYSWFNNDNLLFATDSSYIIEDAVLQDSGIYVLKVDNSIFPELSLTSLPYKLSVLIPVGINDFNLNNLNVYPNPANKEVFIETQNKIVKLEILDIAGNLVYEQESFKSGSINIEQYPKGLYLFRLESEGESVVNKKVIFQ